MKIIAPITIVDSTLAASNVAENDYPAYNAATSYALNDYVIYVQANIHKIYQSLVANNIGNAVDNATKWLDCGATNRWKMFDQSIQSQTQNSASVACIFTINGRCNSLAALNIDAASMRVTMTDAVDGLVYNKTYSLISYAGLNNWYSWLFSPIVRITDIAITDMPSYGNATISVSFASPAATVSVGSLILGNSQIVGGTQYGMKLGTTSYSIKTQDAFGNYTITKRAYRRTGELSVMVDGNYVDQLMQLLGTFRDTPVVYIGTGVYASDLIYGFYSDFSVTVTYPTMSLLAITIQGLT